MGMIKEFKDFAVRGNVIDLAVGIIIGAAFGKIVNSLVNDVIMPPVGMVVGNVDFADVVIPLKQAAEGTEPVMIRIGLFINAIIDFLIVAFAIFLLVKQVNRIKRREAPGPATTRNCPRCISVIDIKASRCPNCTSEIAPASA